MNLRELAQSYLDKPAEDWTFVDRDEIKRLAQFVVHIINYHESFAAGNPIVPPPELQKRLARETN